MEPVRTIRRPFETSSRSTCNSVRRFLLASFELYLALSLAISLGHSRYFTESQMSWILTPQLDERKMDSFQPVCQTLIVLHTHASKRVAPHFVPYTSVQRKLSSVSLNIPSPYHTCLR